MEVWGVARNSSPQSPSCNQRLLGRRHAAAYAYAINQQKGAAMAFAEKLIAVRRAHHLTQEQLAAKLFVTRQAVSRWERDEVTPGIDMMKLIAAVTGEPLSHLLEMPEHYCQSCGMILTPDDCGTDAAGATTDHYCKWCYDHG